MKVNNVGRFGNCDLMGPSSGSVQTKYRESKNKAETDASALDKAEDLLSFLDDDIDVGMKTENRTKKFDGFLGSSAPAKASRISSP